MNLTKSLNRASQTNQGDTMTNEEYSKHCYAVGYATAVIKERNVLYSSVEEENEAFDNIYFSCLESIRNLPGFDKEELEKELSEATEDFQ